MYVFVFLPYFFPFFPFCSCVFRVSCLGGVWLTTTVAAMTETGNSTSRGEERMRNWGEPRGEGEKRGRQNREESSPEFFVILTGH